MRKVKNPTPVLEVAQKHGLSYSDVKLISDEVVRPNWKKGEVKTRDQIIKELEDGLRKLGAIS